MKTPGQENSRTVNEGMEAELHMLTLSQLGFSWMVCLCVRVELRVLSLYVHGVQIISKAHFLYKQAKEKLGKTVTEGHPGLR